MDAEQRGREEFAAWLENEMPSGTVVSNPRWWAPRILRRAEEALSRKQVAMTLKVDVSEALSKVMAANDLVSAFPEVMDALEYYASGGADEFVARSAIAKIKGDMHE